MTSHYISAKCLSTFWKKYKSPFGWVLRQRVVHRLKRRTFGLRWSGGGGMSLPHGRKILCWKTYRCTVGGNTTYRSYSTWSLPNSTLKKRNIQFSYSSKSPLKSILPGLKIDMTLNFCKVSAAKCLFEWSTKSPFDNKGIPGVGLRWWVPWKIYGTLPFYERYMYYSTGKGKSVWFPFRKITRRLRW